MIGLCERCKRRQATFHQMVLLPSKSERHLCDQCALDEGLIAPAKPLPFSEVAEQVIAAAKVAGSQAQRVCENCGTSYMEFRNHGLLGCPHDYEAFKALLEPLLQRVQDNATQHQGKGPGADLAARRAPQAEIRQIQRQLAEAVSAEDYERAAALRDRLRELEER